MVPLFIPGAFALDVCPAEKWQLLPGTGGRSLGGCGVGGLGGGWEWGQPFQLTNLEISLKYFTLPIFRKLGKAMFRVFRLWEEVVTSLSLTEEILSSLIPLESPGCS